jgi:hypothetical protein
MLHGFGVPLAPSSCPLTLFVWLISHQTTVLLFQLKPAISNQPTILLSQNKPAPTISHAEPGAPSPLSLLHISTHRDLGLVWYEPICQLREVT